MFILVHLHQRQSSQGITLNAFERILQVAGVLTEFLLTVARINFPEEGITPYEVSVWEIAGRFIPLAP
jgi:hypothetical protein